MSTNIFSKFAVFKSVPKVAALGAFAFAVVASLGVAAGPAAAAEYTIDPSHTYPAFEADHLGGVSKWRGKINKSEGKLSFDRAAKKGKVDITMHMDSIDFGFEKMNEHARAEDIFNVKKFPTAKFVGEQFGFEGDTLKTVAGQLTLKGVTKPVTLTVTEFLCKQHPFAKREVCGADAFTVINRGDFGVDYALDKGFKSEVKILISIEAIKNP